MHDLTDFKAAALQHLDEFVTIAGMVMHFDRQLAGRLQERTLQAKQPELAAFYIAFQKVDSPEAMPLDERFLIEKLGPRTVRIVQQFLLHAVSAADEATIEGDAIGPAVQRHLPAETVRSAPGWARHRRPSRRGRARGRAT